MSYPFREIEQKWRKYWEEKKIYKFDPESSKPKYYNLFMFPYPSGDRMHIGHWSNYGPMDTHARYKRMRGFNVFQPVGYDALGLPAENYAIKTGIHPAVSNKENIRIFNEQFGNIGAMYDYDFVVNTQEPEYYMWSQWIFLQLYKKGLVYQKEAMANYCPTCCTVVANADVDSESKHDRCSTVIEKKMIKSWFFKITDYAQRLLDDLEKVDFPEKTKLMQKYWIGRSEGAIVKFQIAGSDEHFEVFTTRPDTLYGVTYCTIAPEHELVDRITKPQYKNEVKSYRESIKSLSEIDRQSTVREKTGVFTGSYAVNPVNGENVPIWISDYVLVSYGTGCVMAVPAHDERDFQFAKKFNLPVRVVIKPKDSELNSDTMQNAFEDVGIMMNSAEFTDMQSDSGIKAVIAKLEKEQKGKGHVTFRLRDWNFSRQRYWGTPIPIVYCPKCGTVPVAEKDLPVVLPLDENIDYRPKGKAPLATLDYFVKTTCPSCGGKAEREVETMDTFVCSSWYYLRYFNPKDKTKPFDREQIDRWLPVDCYVGGSEHATGHLIYSRFITKALYDLGYLGFYEPYTKLIHQGLITRNGAKMSKSKGNALPADPLIKAYGIDVVRMYIMFMGNYRDGGDWSDDGISGIDRFASRVYRLIKENYKQGNSADSTINEQLNYMLNNAINEIGRNLEDYYFNTAIARLMELVNEAYVYIGDGKRFDQSYFNVFIEKFLLLFAPFAPHLTEELWESIGKKGSVFNESWPEFDESALVKNTQIITVQVNGKVRSNITAQVDISDEQVKDLVFADGKTKQFTDGKQLVKTIIISSKTGKMVNLVVK
ncbi:TPA: leucine--tRNA ligase [Candidatus Delongbacteria bacterium]|nr:MAG: leucine--tRNA ligase [Candidatus Delongbacteria bacterium GWF2_40_14]HAQ60760.1 leucine--tRNA ligase [Candidatus Delongbacteria bacterium]